MADSDFESHVDDIIASKNAALRRAAEIIGGTAEGYAAELCPVKTGLLRNSITHAISGEAVRKKVYKANKGGKRGSYQGILFAEDGDGKISVYIGTNVQYAPIVELGMPGSKRIPKPYLRPAINNHIAEYRTIYKTEMSDALAPYGG